MGQSSTYRFHHVGVAVRDADEAMRLFGQGYGAVPDSTKVFDENQQVGLSFIQLGGLRVELLEPLSEQSPLHGLLKRGIGLYHVCYEVVDLDAELERLKAEGVKVVSPPKPAVAFGNRRVAFTMCQGLMVELLEAAEA